MSLIPPAVTVYHGCVFGGASLKEIYAVIDRIGDRWGRIGDKDRMGISFTYCPYLVSTGMSLIHPACRSATVVYSVVCQFGRGNSHYICIDKSGAKEMITCKHV